MLYNSFPLAVSFRHAVCCVKSLQLYLTLCDPMNCNPPGSSIHGILQAGTLEWGIFLTQGLNPHLLHLQHWQAGSLPLATPGKPLHIVEYGCQPYSPTSCYLPSPSPCPHICFLHLHLYSCLANRLTYTIFLDSTYVH